MYVFVFDYSFGNVYRFKCPPNGQDIEQMLIDYGLRPDDCHFMVTSNGLIKKEK